MTEPSLSTLAYLAHQAAFGAVAAVGFGILFNFRMRLLIWCATAGAIALGVRTLGQNGGFSLEAATFTAAAVTSCAAVLLGRWLGAASQAVALVGCIPMVPGAFLGEALLGFFSLTAVSPEPPVATIAVAMQSFIRVVATLGAIGAGLAIPPHLFRSSPF